MIIAIRHLPASAHDEEDRWALTSPKILNDESGLLPLPDGDWAIYKPTQSKAQTEQGGDLPSSFKFDRVVTTQTAAPKMTVS